MSFPRYRRPEEWREQILTASRNKRNDRSFDRWVIILMSVVFFGSFVFAGYAVQHRVTLPRLPFLSSTATPAVAAAKPKAGAPKPKPAPVSANGPDFGPANPAPGTPAITVVSFNSPAQIGQRVTLVAHTAPGATVYPLIYYSAAPVQLPSQVADADGLVTFNYFVLSTRHAGSYHVDIVARLNGQENTTTIPYVVTG